MKKKMFVFLTLALLMAMSSVMPVYARRGNRNNDRPQAYCDYGCFAGLSDRDFDPDALLEKREAYLDALVAGGYITQARADERLERFRAMIEFRVENGVWQCQWLDGAQCPRNGEAQCWRNGESQCRRVDEGENSGGSRSGNCRRRNGN